MHRAPIRTDPDFRSRSNAPEWMDNLSIDGPGLRASLRQLRRVNRWLGGYSSVLSALTPYLQSASLDARSVRLLDVGAGIGDMSEVIVNYSRRRWPALDLAIVAVDANPATADYAKATLREKFGPDGPVTPVCADALCLPYADGSFDIAVASLLLHHMPGDDAVRLLAEMNRVSRAGIVVSDLHRHPLAYYGFAALAAVLRADPMVRHDGPVSVLRGFTRSEIRSLWQRANLSLTVLRWQWAFRWVATSMLDGRQ